MGKVLTDEEFWIVFKDILFADERIEDAEEEVEKMIELLGLESNDKILDMPCGVGRHVKVLEDKGFDIVGVDKTRDYVEDARERTDSEIVNKDMKDFRREERFDAVINWWNSFGYFENKEDDVQMIENIKVSLKDGGVLLMDIWSKELTAMGDMSQRWSRESDSYHLQEHKIEDDWKKVKNTWIKVEDGMTMKYTWEKRLYSAAELEQLLLEAGFSEVEFYGNLDGDPYDHEAERMIVKASK